MQNIIELQGIQKHYKQFSLGPLDLAVPAGCITGFIGENGAGKSTSINILLGLVEADAGQSRLFERDDYLHEKRLYEDIGVVLDECCIHESFNVKNTDAVMRHVFRNWDPHAFKGYCERFKLPEAKKVKDYSQGMRRKLDIAIALSHHAKLLILDEPTSGLDPIVRDELLDVFLEFIQQEDHAIFLSTHILSDLEKACDYIAFLHKGKLVLHEQKDALRERFCIIKGGQEAIERVDKRALHGIRRNSFGVEALCERSALPPGMAFDPASIEDIMLFYIKEGQI